MQLKESRRATEEGGWVELMKRQAGTKGEDGPKVDGSGSKGGDQSGSRVMSPRRIRLKTVAGISHILLPFLAHSSGCAGLVGSDVVKISGYE